VFVKLEKGMKKSGELKGKEKKNEHQVPHDEEVFLKIQKRRDENEALKKILGSLNQLQYNKNVKTKP
jgi:hypothetical protein